MHYVPNNIHTSYESLDPRSHVLTPWSRVFLEKLTVPQLVKNFPAFYGTRRFVTAFTSAHHLSLSWASLIQSMPPYPTSWRSIRILSSHLCLGLPSGLVPSGFPTKTLYAPLLSPIHATCPAHLILLSFITQTIFGEKNRPLSSSLCSFLYSPITSSLLCPRILLSTLFSNTLSLALNVGDQVAHPYKTTKEPATLRSFYLFLYIFLWLYFWDTGNNWGSQENSYLSCNPDINYCRDAHINSGRMLGYWTLHGGVW